MRDELTREIASIYAGRHLIAQAVCPTGLTLGRTAASNCILPRLATHWNALHLSVLF